MWIYSKASLCKLEVCKILFLAVTMLLWCSLSGVEANEVCQTEACKFIANMVLSRINESVKPCDDFYRFACQRFVEDAKIPDYEDEVSSITELQVQIYEQLRTIVERMPDPNASLPFRNLHHYYSQCMDLESINAHGVGNAVKKLRQVGGWPVLGDWNEEIWNFLDTEIRIKAFGMSGESLFQIYTDIDLKNTSRRFLVVDQAALGLDQDYLVNGEDDPKVKAYYSYMVDIAVMLGANRTTASEQLRDSLLLEIELAKLSTPKEQRRDANRMYNLYNLKNLQTEFSWLNWERFLSSILPKNLPLLENEIVNVMEVKYLKDLGDFISKHPKKVVANYMVWRAVSGLIDELGDEFRNRTQEFNAIAHGATVPIPRWIKCIHKLEEHGFEYVLSNLYVKTFFDMKTKKQVLTLADKLKKEMYEMIQEVDWMDNLTREMALKKVQHIQGFFGYPDDILNVSKIEQLYDGLVVDGNDFLEETLKLTKWFNGFSARLLREPVSPEDWRFHSDVTNVNAYNDVTQNSINFPAGYLQLPFFDANLPNFVNYAAIGHAIGHEITHGFDDEGSQFDHNGKLEEWWTNKSKTIFKEKAKCFVDQYNNFVDNKTGLHLNGINTQGENIADSGGLKMAFRAYLGLNLDEPLLPGLEKYSQEQLFFITFASLNCAKSRTEALQDMITTDEHPPNESRVKGMIQNSRGFSVAFACTEADAMNPPDKCAVW